MRPAFTIVWQSGRVSCKVNVAAFDAEEAIAYLKRRFPEGRNFKLVTYEPGYTLSA